MKKTNLLVSFTVIAILILFTACKNNPGKIMIDQAESIVQPYFQESYGKIVVVKK